MPFNVLRQEPLQIALSVDPGRQELINAFASWMDGLIPDVEIDRFINNENDSSVRLALVALKNWYITEGQTPDQHINRVSDGRLAQAIRSLYTVGLGDVKDLEYLTQRAINILTSAGPGAWYDPSDLTTLFQDSAGTTPVTAVEQPVGLMLDKSQGLVLGANTATGSWINTYATAFDAFTPSGSGGFTATTTGAKSGIRVGVPCTLAVGKTYTIDFTVTLSSATLNSIWFSDVGLGGITAVQGTATATSGVAFRVTGTTSTAVTHLMLILSTSGASTVSVSGFTVRELPGAHLIQPTATSRPTLSSRYNLLTKTEQFDDVVWTKTDLTVTANAVASPDGTTTADKLIEAATTAWHNTNGPNITLAVAQYTMRVYAKAAERSVLQIVPSGAAFPASYANFNLSAGTVSAQSGIDSATITSVGNGWYLCAVVDTATAAGADKGMFVSVQSSPAAGRAATYLGDGASGVFIWGASLVPASDASLPYQRINTATDYDFDFTKFPPFLRLDGIDDGMYTAASVDFNGLPADGQTKRNLLSASEAFDDVFWQKTAATITPNATTAPDGTATADKLVESTATAADHYALKVLGSAISGVSTYSVYAKAAGRSHLQLAGVDTSTPFRPIYDLSSGTVVSSGGATAFIEAVGNGWYRCGWTRTSANLTQVTAILQNSATYQSYTGDGTSGVFVWGAQLEAGSTATAYQKTGTDKMTVFAGVHKASDAADGALADFGDTIAGVNNGAFYMGAPAVGGAAKFQFVSRGTINAGSFTSDTAHNAPTSRVITGVGDVAGDRATLRLNGTQVAQAVTDQGTGNFGNYPLYIGRRNNASLPFNGRLYQLAIKGKALSAAEITTVESFVNSKTKAF